MAGRLLIASLMVMALASGGLQPLSAAEVRDIRVGLEQGQGEVTIRGGPFFLRDGETGQTLVEETSGSSLQVKKDGERLKLPDSLWPSRENKDGDDEEEEDKNDKKWEGSVLQLLTVESGQRLEYDGKPYRGKLEVQVRDGGLTVVNELPLEEYLYGVVPREMPASFPQQALRAQAVAARTYALGSLGKHQGEGFDICATTHCQVYGGAQEADSTNRAVDDTSGEVMRYQGELVQAYYHACSGGHTEDSDKVWGGTLPYLQGVPDLTEGSPYQEWKLELDAEDLAGKLQERGKSVGEIKGIQVVERTDSGRVARLAVEGNRENQEITGEELRSMLGYGQLRSTLFEVSIDQEVREVPAAIRWEDNDYVWILDPDGEPVERRAGELAVLGRNQAGGGLHVWAGESKTEKRLQEVVFTGKGFGHGVGMSQWGARARAEQAPSGADDVYRDILKHYYQGVTIERY